MSLQWQIVGALAMLMIEASYVPQIMRLYRLKNAEDFSLFFPLLNGSGRVLGLLYTGLNGDIVMALGFLLGIVLRLTLLGQVWHYKRMQRLSLAEAPQPSLWTRLKQWYARPTPPLSSHTASLSSLVTSQQGSDLLLQPALCRADACAPRKRSQTLHHDDPCH